MSRCRCSSSPSSCLPATRGRRRVGERCLRHVALGFVLGARQATYNGSRRPERLPRRIRAGPASTSVESVVHSSGGDADRWRSPTLSCLRSRPHTSCWTDVSLSPGLVREIRLALSFIEALGEESQQFGCRLEPQLFSGINFFHVPFEPPQFRLRLGSEPDNECSLHSETSVGRFRGQCVSFPLNFRDVYLGRIEENECPRRLSNMTVSSSCD